MNKLELETSLSDHHKIRVKRFMNTIVLETGLSDHHKIRVKVSWTH